VRSGEIPIDYVQRMAIEKAAAVAPMHRGESCTILAADTTVVLKGDILGKPASKSHGLEILGRLSGNCHRVITALCLRTHDDVSLRAVQTDVQFVTLDRQACEAYMATEEPWDKAGSYAIQGLGGAFVREIRGSYSNVVGLPLAETWELLAEHGIATTLSPLSN